MAQHPDDATTNGVIGLSIMDARTEDDIGFDLFNHHRTLVDWATALGGYLHPDVRIAHSAEKGFHAIVAANKQVRAETRIVSCPMAATMSVLNALDVEPFYSHGTKFPQSFLQANMGRPELIQTFFLMDQYARGNESWWAPYVRALPSPLDVNEMQFDSAEDVAWLEGTNLKTGFAEQTTKWQELYMRGLRGLKIAGWRRALNGTYTWELFRWAATMFGSRSFTSSVLDDTLPADQARMSDTPGIRCDMVIKNLFINKFAVLLPMLDILNHWPVTPVEWQARSTFVGMQILETYEAGQELCNNYGPKDNEGLLLSYGFTIPENHFDHVVIAISPTPNSPLADASEWERDERSHPELKKFLLHPDHPSAKQASCLEACSFSYDLLNSISILCANDRELQTMYMTRRSLMSSSLGRNKTFDDYRNLLVSLSQLLRECRARGEILFGSYPHHSTPRSAKQRAAQVYRSSQYLLHQTACIISEYVLLRAGTDWTHEALMKLMKQRFCSQTVARFRKMYESHSCVTSRGELLSEHQVLEMLPTAACFGWRAMSAKLTDTASSFFNDPSQIEMAKTKMQFAILLSKVYLEYKRGTKLPARMKSWMQRLSQWYPPSDQNWSYVPHKGPWPPGEEPPVGLMAMLEARDLSLQEEPPETVDQCLNPEMLCWGWNVMEEETVVVPANLINLMDPDISLKGPIGLRLYCEH